MNLAGRCTKCTVVPVFENKPIELFLPLRTLAILGRKLFVANSRFQIRKTVCRSELTVKIGDSRARVFALVVRP